MYKPCSTRVLNISLPVMCLGKKETGVQTGAEVSSTPFFFYCTSAPFWFITFIIPKYTYYYTPRHSIFHYYYYFYYYYIISRTIAYSCLCPPEIDNIKKGKKEEKIMFSSHVGK